MTLPIASSPCVLDVAIVGCGPAGAVAAALLGQAGLRVHVCDRLPGVYEIPRAIALDHEVMRVFQQLGLVEHVRNDLGPYLAAAFAQLAEHPLVGQAETCGLMGALLLVKDKAKGTAFDAHLEVGMRCRAHCFTQGVIMRAVGDRMIIAPPLVITRAQVDEMVALIRRCLDLTLADAHAQGWMA